MSTPTSTGHLNPGDPEVVFDRFTLGEDLAELVRHVWVVRWSVPAGQVRTQRMLTYPAFNVVFEPGVCGIYPPRPQLQLRDLSGTGWGVGLLLRPGAATAFVADPRRVPPQGDRLPAAPVSRVGALLSTGWPGNRAELVVALRDWTRPAVDRLDAAGRLVNAACDLAEHDPGILRATDIADRLAVSLRTLERLLRARIGLTPKWLIDCRRMQQAATTLHARPDLDLSRLAADLGFTDYPHFSRLYRRIIGQTPKQTARERSATSSVPTPA